MNGEGLQILAILLVPTALVYVLVKHVVGMNVRHYQNKVAVTPPPAPPTLYRLRPKILRYCNFHLTSLPKGRICLVVRQAECDFCKKGIK